MDLALLGREDLRELGLSHLAVRCWERRFLVLSKKRSLGIFIAIFSVIFCFEITCRSKLRSITLEVFS